MILGIKKPFWRDEDANIVCAKDDCQQRCSEECPIWHNMKGEKYLHYGLTEKAIEEFKKAVSIAIDYTEAYNSLGMIYVSMKRYQEAHDAFYEAVERKNDQRAIQGLIIASINLGLYQEALDCCDEFEYHLGCSVQELREEAERLSARSCRKKKVWPLDTISYTGPEDLSRQTSGSPANRHTQDPGPSIPKFCRECGTRLSPSARYCPNCGWAIQK